MPVPLLITDLNIAIASNSPDGTVDPPSSIDNYLRAHAAFIAQLNVKSASTDMTPVVTAATLAAARTAFGVAYERGSGANGEYIRFADGLQINTKVTLVNATVAAGAYATFSGTTAAAFVGTPTRSYFGSFNVAINQTGNDIFGSVQMFGNIAVLINTGREAQLLVPSFTTLGTSSDLSYRLYETTVGSWF